MPPAGPKDGTRPPGEGEEALRELALRLLSPSRPEVARGGQPRLFVGRLPDHLPVEIPIPDGFDIVGSLARADERHSGPQTHVVLDAPIGAEQVRETYRELMGTAGWSESKFPSRMGGGFAFGPRASLLLFCEEESGTALILGADELPNAPTDVRLWLDTSPRSPCIRRQPVSALEEEWLIPRLVQPTGAREYPDGRSVTRQTDFESSTVIVDADARLAEMVAHYNAQLSLRGWTLSGEDLSGPQAWSSWEFSDDQGHLWAGMFTALELTGTPRRYLLRVLAYRREEHRVF